MTMSLSPGTFQMVLGALDLRELWEQECVAHLAYFYFVAWRYMF
jgi:hypothetical protein